MANPNPEDEIIREPENYAEMIKKLEEREKEALERAHRKLGSDETAGEAILIEGARKELSQLRGRRDFKALSATEKEKKIEPADPHVLEVRNTVVELSRRIDSAIKMDPEASRALLRGRVTLGKPESKSGVTS